MHPQIRSLPPQSTRNVKRKTYDGDILELDVELTGTLSKVLTDFGRDELTLGNELTSIKLGNNRLQHLVSDRGQYTLIIIHAESLVDLGQVLDFRAVEDTEGQGDHLHILGSSGGGDVTGFGTDIELDGTLQPGDQEMSALANGVGLDSLNSVENDGTVTSLDYIVKVNEGVLG